MSLIINHDNVKDTATREALRQLLEAFNAVPILRGKFQFLKLTFMAAGTFKQPHNLPFVPRDVLVTSRVGAGIATFNFANFDATNLSITTTGECIVRFFVGNYQENSEA